MADGTGGGLHNLCLFWEKSKEEVWPFGDTLSGKKACVPLSREGIYIILETAKLEGFALRFDWPWARNGGLIWKH